VSQGIGLVRRVHSVTGEWVSEEGALVSQGSGLEDGALVSREWASEEGAQCHRGVG